MGPYDVIQSDHLDVALSGSTLVLIRASPGHQQQWYQDVNYVK